ncbi:MAG: type II CRISPR-associated endonuclease Cas1 [Bacteroidetes bacterium]|nr:type II CRISPR-associated endonuclease Cas1 [Bacteroidota bacterium]
MLKRTLFFSNPYKLNLQNNQLIATPEADGDIVSVPIEDIGFVILENMRLSLSMSLIEALMSNNAAIVFCNSKHHPQSMLLNLDGNNTQNETIRQQIEAGIPLKKNLWKQTVEAKITNQAYLLKKLGIKHNTVLSFAKDVKSGDPENREGAAAREYWGKLFGKDFNRERFGEYPNDLLNYGYIILRAAVARALVGSGLMPALGIHHSNKYNSYCLADDIMEPYRPFVDARVYNIYKNNPEDQFLNKETKAELLKVLADDVFIDKNRRPLMIALSNTTASLVKCFFGETKKIKYPLLQ